MIKIVLSADDTASFRDVGVSADSSNVEKAMLLAQLRIVEQFLLDSMNDDWSVEI